MKIKGKPFSILGGFFYLMLQSHSAYAISCLGNVEKTYDESETVVLVQPSISSKDIAVLSKQNKKVLPIQVLQVWKRAGNLPRTITLIPNLYGEFPSFVQKPYILFLQKKADDGSYIVNPCSGQIHLQPGYEDLMFLFLKESKPADYPTK